MTDTTDLAAVAAGLRGVADIVEGEATGAADRLMARKCRRAASVLEAAAARIAELESALREAHEDGRQEGIEEAARLFDERAAAFYDLAKRHEKSGRPRHAERERVHAIREKTFAKSIRALSSQEGKADG